MRVSKTVKEYIEKEVTIRLEPKYAAEKAEAARQEKIRTDLLEKAAHEARMVWDAVIDAGLAQPGTEFMEDRRESDYGGNCPTFYNSCAVAIRNRQTVSSIHQWYSRMVKERMSIVNNIIVELELGGTKADLERLLNEIGKG